MSTIKKEKKPKALDIDHQPGVPLPEGVMIHQSDLKPFSIQENPEFNRILSVALELESTLRSLLNPDPSRLQLHMMVDLPRENVRRPGWTYSDAANYYTETMNRAKSNLSLARKILEEFEPR